MSKECGNGKGKRASIPPSAKLENLLPPLKSPRPIVLGKDCDYDRELRRLQIELVKLQKWIRKRGLKVIVLFEGSDAAGKGVAIRRITQSLNPRVCRVVALGTPTEREKAQWYFQRYGADLPAADELVLFDRSWYKRAGGERVMGFCTETEYMEFLHSGPEFERMLVCAGIILIQYWFSASDEEPERRFQDRMNDPTKRWKLSAMEVPSRARWAQYPRARARCVLWLTSGRRRGTWSMPKTRTASGLTSLRHLLSAISYEDLTPEPTKLPPVDKTKDIRPSIEEQNFIPELYRR